MGSAVEPNELVRAEYMFGLLGYSTWNLYYERTWIGQVTLNPVDRLVVFVGEPEQSDLAAAFADRPFRWWMGWLRRHRHEPL